MRIKTRAFFLLILILVGHLNNGLAQIIPSSVDLSYLFDANANIHLTHKVITKAEKKWILLETIGRNEIELDSLTYTFAFTNNLSDVIQSFSLVALNSFELTNTRTKRLFGFEATNKNFHFLILRIKTKEDDVPYSYIINLKTKSSFFISYSNLTIPIVQGYAKVASELKIAKLTPDSTTFGVQFYTKTFKPSLPPMANLKTESPFKVADTTYSLTTQNTLPSTKKGVYSIFEEHNEKTVSFFRISAKNYPQLSSIDELIEASIFLFTKKEKNKITTSSTPKKEYDAFWLENTGSSERASKMISAYFKRVKESNQLFVSYKEGWKTDMGMIYIIFGPPDKVFKSNGSIEWVYQKTYELPTIIFKYNLKNENLDTEYFELERSIKYQNNWFRAIDLWRKGRKNL